MAVNIIETTEKGRPCGDGPDRALDRAGFEKTTAIFLVVLLFILKVIYSFAYRADSDETQHLHVVWGWANGLLPYRDLFDNHAPLFQFLCSPLFRVIGERPDILIPMRWAMIPLYFLCLWCIYRCGTILLSRRLAIWAALLTGAYPTFFIKSTEFRTDDLWAPLWLLSIVALMRRPLGSKNIFFAGLALGAAFATSMKTSALLISLTIACVLVLTRRAIQGAPVPWKSLPGLMVAGLAGVAIVPAIVIAYFAWKEALPNLSYGVVHHNLVAGFFRLEVFKRARLFVLPTLLSAIGGYVTVRATSDPARRDRLALLALTATALSLMFGLYWPIIEPHDLLPLVPLAVLAAVPALSRALKSDELSPVAGFRSYAFPLIAGAEIALLLAFSPPAPHALDETTNLISDVLRLTTKQDQVMDAKGESVFRQRAFYYVLEGVTLRRLQLGLIPDNIPERLVATRAPVATILRTPPRARQFIEKNYIPVAYRLRVLGQMLSTSDEEMPKTCAFEIAIPAEYRLLAEHGNLEATLDGTPFPGTRFLSPGHHEVRASSGSGRIALVLASAIEQGFSPFSAQANDVGKSGL